MMNKEMILKRIKSHQHWIFILLIIIMQGIISLTLYKDHREYTKPAFEANKIEYMGYSDISKLHTYRLDGDMYVTTHDQITILLDKENGFTRDGVTTMIPKSFPLVKSKEHTWESNGYKDDELRFVTIKRTLVEGEKSIDEAVDKKELEFQAISIEKVPITIDEMVSRINQQPIDWRKGYLRKENK